MNIVFSSIFEKYSFKSIVVFLLMATVMFGISLISANPVMFIVALVMFAGSIVMFVSPSINPGSFADNSNSYCCPGVKSFIFSQAPKHTSFS